MILDKKSFVPVSWQGQNLCAGFGSKSGSQMGRKKLPKQARQQQATIKQKRNTNA